MHPPEASKHRMEGVNQMKSSLETRKNRRRYGWPAVCFATCVIAVLSVYDALAVAQTKSVPASQPASQPSSDAPEIGGTIPTFVNTTTNLVAPVLVTDRAGNIVDNLQPNQFHLYDNGVEQNIHVDSAYQPISLVVAIEKSSRVDGILPKLQKLGILLSQITGKSGEAAILAFDCRLQTPQDFTTDNDKIVNAINNLKSGCQGTRLNDAVERGVYMLSKRPASNRRILLLISETRDEGSQARIKEVMI